MSEMTDMIQNCRRPRADVEPPLSASMVDRLPPHDLSAEQALLAVFMAGGALLSEPADCMAALTVCQQQFGEYAHEVFYDLKHQEIFKAMVFLKARDTTFDLVTLQTELLARRLLDQVGGMHYLSAIQDVGLGPKSAEQYRAIVWEKFLARKLIQRNVAQVQEIYESGELTETKIANIELRHEEWKRLLGRGEVSPKHLAKPNDFGEAYYNQFFNPNRDTFGYGLPFEYVLRLRPKATTLFTGDNGSGKSSMLCLMSVVVATQLDVEKGEKVVVASMEMPPEVTLWIMARQLLGLGHLERTEENIAKIVRALAWLNQRVLLYNFLGITDKNDLLSTFEYAAAKASGKFFIIDNMMKVGIADDDYAAQGHFIQGVCDFSMKREVHTVVVVHENKGDGNVKQRIRGSKQLTDAPDNVVKMERNLKKADQLADLKQEERAGVKSKEEIAAAHAKLAGAWDAKFTHHKQRWPGSDQNGSKWLYFHRESLQFHTEPNLAAIDYTL